MGPGWFVTSLLLCLHTSLVRAALVNVTIDDTYGDPVTGAQVVYEPDAAWNSGPSCTSCTAHPDASLAYNNTWHDGTFATVTGTNSATGSILSFSVPFNGSAIYVYCILTFTASSPDGNSDMQFFIDDVPVGGFELAPNGSTTYDYNVPVYVNETIPAGIHTFSLESGHSGQKSLVMFDSMVYSYDNGLDETNPGQSNPTQSGAGSGASVSTTPVATSSSHKSNTVVVVVATLVSLACIAIIGGLVVIILISRRRRRNRRAEPGLTATADYEPRSDTSDMFPREGRTRRWFARSLPVPARRTPPLMEDRDSSSHVGVSGSEGGSRQRSGTSQSAYSQSQAPSFYPQALSPTPSGSGSNRDPSVFQSPIDTERRLPARPLPALVSPTQFEDPQTHILYSQSQTAYSHSASLPNPFQSPTETRVHARPLPPNPNIGNGLRTSLHRPLPASPGSDYDPLPPYSEGNSGSGTMYTFSKHL